jgi:membrane protein YdbS with pleckstrin-like domain
VPHAQRKLRCESLRKDAITSGAVAVLSAAIVVSTLLYAVHPQLWWFDSLVALCISLALFAAGLVPLLTMRWWSPAFWAPLAELVACLLPRAEHGTSCEV